ncbi:MAG: diguanylate cyclase [Sterolibacterium sp.]
MPGSILDEIDAALADDSPVAEQPAGPRSILDEIDAALAEDPAPTPAPADEYEEPFSMKPSKNYHPEKMFAGADPDAVQANVTAMNEKKQNAILKAEGVGRFPDASQVKKRLENSNLSKVPIVGDALTTGATGLASGLMDMAATATGLIGADEISKDIRGQSHAANEGDKSRYNGGVTGWLADRERGLTNALPKLAAGGGATGTAAIFGLDGTAQAAQAADDAGVTGPKKYVYAGSVGLMNALQGLIFGKLFNGAASIPKGAAIDALKAHGAEVLKGSLGNMAVSTVDHLVARLTDVDKTEWTPEELVSDGVNALGDAAAMHGAGKIMSAMDFAKKNPEIAAEIAAKDSLSRKDAATLGITDTTSVKERTDIHEALRKVFEEQSVEPGADVDGPRPNTPPADYPNKLNRPNQQERRAGMETAEAPAPSPIDQIWAMSGELKRLPNQREIAERLNVDPETASFLLKKAQQDFAAPKPQPATIITNDSQPKTLPLPEARQPVDDLRLSKMEAPREPVADPAMDTLPLEDNLPPLLKPGEVPLEGMRMSELYETAKAAGLAGYRGKSKVKIISEIRAAQESQAPAEPEGAAPERRVDDVRRKNVDEMTPDEMKAEVQRLRVERHTDSLTGLRNEVAYNESSRKPVQVFGDIDGLKQLNDRFGHDAGNALLIQVANSIRETGLEGAAFRKKGDEHLFEFDKQEQADRAMALLADHMSGKELIFHGSDGKEYVLDGIRMSHGVAGDIKQAEVKAGEMKNARERAGQRELRSSWEQRFKEDPAALPLRVREGTPARDEVRGNPRQEDGQDAVPARQEEPAADQAPEDSVEYLGSMGGNALNPAAVNSFAKKAVKGVTDFARGKGGESAPKTTALSRPAGEAVVRHGAAKIAAPRIYEEMYSKVFKGDDELGDRAMAVMVEDNLRDLKKNSKTPDDVASVVGEHDGAIFKTEAEYQAALKDPKVQEAIERWKETVNPWMDEQYRTLQALPEGQELKTRGAQTGARINLKAIREDAANMPPPDATMGSSSGNLNAPRQNFNVFGKSAKGTAEAYDTNARNVLQNTVFRTWNSSTRVKMLNSLVNSGVGKLAADGKPITEIHGEPTAKIQFDVAGETKLLYVPKSIERELRMAMGTDMAPSILGEKGGQILTQVQLYGITDFVAHGANVLRALTQAPKGKNFVEQLARAGVAPADGLVQMFSSARDIAKNSPEVQARLRELAEIGALRGDYEGHGTGKFSLLKPWEWSGIAIKKMDDAARLALDGMYTDLVKRGLKQDTETGRREFVNQIGQYNSRLQGWWTSLLKRSGFSPFITAGTTFNRGGRSVITGETPGEATSKMADAKLRAAQIGGNVVMGVTIAAAINSMTGSTKRNIPLGAIDLHKKDEDGKDEYLDLLTWTGARRGLRTTGMDAVIEGIRQGRGAGEILDSAKQQVVNSAMHPLMGPAPKFAINAAFGVDPAIGAPSAPAAKPGESQSVRNLKYAAKELNPMVAAGVEGFEASKLMGGSNSDALKKATKEATVSALSGAVGLKSARKPTSQALDLAQDFLRRRQPAGSAATDDDQESRVIRAKLVEAIREGKDPQQAIKEAVASGEVTEKQAFLSAKKGHISPTEAVFKALSLTEANQVLKVATDAEKAEWQDLYDLKIGAKAKTMARPMPLKKRDGKTLAELKEAWRVDVGDAARMLKEAGVDDTGIRRAYKAVMKGKKPESITSGMNLLNHQLKKLQTQKSVGNPLAMNTK